MLARSTFIRSSRTARPSTSHYIAIASPKSLTLFVRKRGIMASTTSTTPGGSAGLLSYDELVGFLAQYGHQEPVTHIKQLFARCDKTGIGKIHLSEFLHEMIEDKELQHQPLSPQKTEVAENYTVVTTTRVEKKFVTETRSPTKFEQFFRDADTDNSGDLSYDELADMMQKTGFNLSESRMKRMFEKCDTNGDGKIQLVEFLNEMGQDYTPETQTYVEETKEVHTHVQGEKLTTQTSETSETTVTVDTSQTSNPTHVSKYEQFFREADKDHNGYLSFHELVDILKKNGFADPEYNVKLIFWGCDVSMDGQISLEEFLREMGLRELPEHVKRDDLVLTQRDELVRKYERFFRMADQDNNGFLSFDEVVDILRKNGSKDPTIQVKRMFTTCDTSGDGQISLDEFMTEMMKKKY